ncbi:MAG: leucine-rich repeat protein [Firmicutes bacterium]|nr:leucine-rich repeat protein [Bacillota bacterium]
MIPFENDLIRFFATKAKIKKKKDNINMQLGYCIKNFKDDTKDLTSEQMSQIKSWWDKISFAYPVNAEWHKMYTSKTGVFSPFYIPNELHYYFVEYNLIDYDYLRAFTDKNYLGLLFSDIKQPPTVIRCIKGLYYKDDFTPINLDEAVEIVKENSLSGIVIKPSIHSWGGRNISFIKEELSNTRVKSIFSNYGKNFIIQNVITQHPALANIHSESVNTMRIITILINGQVNILSACLRMGVGKSKVDNFSQGGVGCGIKDNGQLKPVGYDRFGNKVLKHPNGFKFENCIIPNFNRIKETVIKAAMRVPQFGVASWDFALDKEGVPVLIEYNVSQGGIDIHQYNNGPLYGEKTEEIFEYVFKNYCFEDTTLQYNYNVFKDHVTIKKASKDMRFIYVKDIHHNIAVTRIGEHAFENSKIKRVRLPKTITNIDYCAFYNCLELKKIKLPSELKVIGRSAFNNCINLKYIHIPSNVTTIGKLAFKGIESLEIYIPNSVINIAEDAFEGCENLTISAEENSYAYHYAKSHGFKVEI